MRNPGWRPIPGYEGLYGVTEGGEVLSLPRPGPGTGGRPIIRMRFFRTTDGYLRVALSSGGKARKFLVHRLVAAAWLPEAPSACHELNHIDGVKENNARSNLEWVTRSENLKHAAKLGLRNTERGDSHPTTKLTYAMSESAVQMLREGASVASTAAQFGVHRTTLQNARRRLGVETKRGNYEKAKLC